jgi:hypothetical protein
MMLSSSCAQGVRWYEINRIGYSLPFRSSDYFTVEWVPSTVADSAAGSKRKTSFLGQAMRHDR